MFDCFLSYNRSDESAVRALAGELRGKGVSVWLDEEQLPPGIPWQPLLEDGIRASRSIVVLVGRDGLGPWQAEEIRAALSLAIEDRRPVIPVLLAGAPAMRELPMFLRERTWVDLRSSSQVEGFVGLDQLVWGITGARSDVSSPRDTMPPWSPYDGKSLDEWRLIDPVPWSAAGPEIHAVGLSAEVLTKGPADLLAISFALWEPFAFADGAVSARCEMMQGIEAGAIGLALSVDWPAYGYLGLLRAGRGGAALELWLMDDRQLCPLAGQSIKRKSSERFTELKLARRSEGLELSCGARAAVWNGAMFPGGKAGLIKAGCQSVVFTDVRLESCGLDRRLGQAT